MNRSNGDNVGQWTKTRCAGATVILLLAALGSACGNDATPAQTGRQASSGTGAPRIGATPNPVPRTAPMGSTTIVWDSGDGSWAQVYVSVDGKPETPFFEGPKGNQTAPWIAHGSQYRFRLYKAMAHTELLAEVMVAQEAFLTADPNPAPAQKGFGKTTIAWSTGNGHTGQVYVSAAGAPEVLFGEATGGTLEAPWIGAGDYRFTLYEGTDRRVVLASAVVRRADTR